MSNKKLLIASSHRSEAITNWIMNNPWYRSHVDLLFIDELLKELDIMDVLNDKTNIIKWKRKDNDVYTNQSHCLLNRVIYLDEALFCLFREQDRDYAKREFEAYLGFAFNSFQTPQNQTVNGVCERPYSLPQQWQLIKKHTNLRIPNYYWGSRQFNHYIGQDCVIHSDIFNLLLWSVCPKQTPTGFSFIKPQGKPIFILSVGNSSLLTYEEEPSSLQRQQIENIIQHLRKLFGYFIFEALIFISREDITFGCINIDIIRSQKNPFFNAFLEQCLIKEYYQCLI